MLVIFSMDIWPVSFLIEKKYVKLFLHLNWWTTWYKNEKANIHWKVLILRVYKVLILHTLAKALKGIQNVDLLLLGFFLKQGWAHTGYIWMCLFSCEMLHLAGRFRITSKLPSCVDWHKYYWTFRFHFLIDWPVC